MRNDYGRDDSNVTTKLTYLLIGGGIGAVIALLFAPKSGQELRELMAAHESEPDQEPGSDARALPIS